MRCPRCKLLSPAGSLLCDCGYQLDSPADAQHSNARNRAYLERKRFRDGARWILMLNVFPWGWYSYMLLQPVRGKGWWSVPLVFALVISATLAFFAILVNNSGRRIQ